MATDRRIDLRGIRPGAATNNQGIVLQSGIWVPGDVVRGLTSSDSSVNINSADPAHPDLTVASGAGGAGWDHTLGLPLSTLTGWTAGTGTWAISSGVIRQSSTANNSNRLRYTAAPVSQAGIVAEMDIKIDVAPNNPNSRSGFMFGYPPAADTTGSVLACLQCTTSGFVTKVYWEYEGVTAGPAITLATPIALGTWTTFRAYKVSGDVTVWINGTLIGTAHVKQDANLNASTLALYSYATDVSFRNLDVWTPTMP